MRILVAFDGSGPARSILDEVSRRPWPPATEVRIVSVAEWPVGLEPPFPTDGPTIEHIRKIRVDHARQELEQARQSLGSLAGLAVSVELREGNPKHELLEAIDQWKPDLVMAGSKGKTGLQRLFLGSVCQALVAHAPCSVEVVKAHPPA